MEDEWAMLPEIMDSQYYENLDPFFHYVIIATLGQGELPEMKMTWLDGNETTSHRIIDKLKESDKNRKEYLKSLGRVFRYFSSETLILLLLAGGPFGPFVRVASVVKFDRLNKVFQSVGNRHVPKEFEITVSKKKLDFVSWVSFLAFGQPDWIAENKQLDIIELIVEEAEMLTSRGAVNAFKHGKPLSFGKSLVMNITDTETGDSAETIQLEGVNWMEWKEKNGAVQFSFFTEEINPEEDQKRLFAVALLIDAIREVRLAKIKGIKTVNMNVPCGFETGLAVKRQNFTINLTPKEEAE